MPFFDLVNTATGELIVSAAEHDEQPADPVGKGWSWQPTIKPDASVTQGIVWDPVTRSHVLAALANDAAMAALDKLAGTLTAQVKADAYDVIVGRVPEWKQRNLTARGVQLLRKIVLATATADEIAEADAIEATWDEIVAIRGASNTAETAIAAARAADDEAAMRAAALVTWPAPAGT